MICCTRNYRLRRAPSPPPCAAPAGTIVASELVNTTRRYFADRGVNVKVEYSWGATEVKASLPGVGAIVDITETGSSLRANKLRVRAHSRWRALRRGCRTRGPPLQRGCLNFCVASVPLVHKSSTTIFFRAKCADCIDEASCYCQPPR
jgi:hypothetical protein